MEVAAQKRKIFFYASIGLLILGLLSWSPYLVFDIQEPYSMLTLLLNPVGAIFGYLANSRFLIIANIFMIFSFILVMVYVYFSKGYIPT